MSTSRHSFLVLRLIGLVACNGGQPAPPTPVATQVEQPEAPKPAKADATPSRDHPFRTAPKPLVFSDANEARRFSRCSADNQCVAVRNSCCPDRGTLVGVRKDKWREFQQRLQCEGVDCSTVATIGRAPVIPRCEQEMCTVTYGPWSESSDF